jgi:hypothetical protein|tara:strand:+ start:245 stop:991 length:747 start_codon:yes stop_codon:yes gene_type:complete
MSNAIQLDLFHGKVLTAEQQEEVNRFIKSQAERAIKAEKRNNKTMLMLDEAGFVYGQDYSSNFEVEEVTKEQRFGYGYNNTDYEFEVTYIQNTGNVFLWVNTIKDGEIKIYKSSLDVEGDKLMCTSITKQYRHYKPSSLLVKYKEHNQRIANKLEYENKQSVALNNVVANFQTFYPDAQVTIGSDYYRGTRNYDSFPIVKVEFKSGSYISFQLGYGDKMEEVRFHKKYDAQSETTDQLLTRFNNQKAK